jgi:hypothetical protein
VESRTEKHLTVTELGKLVPTVRHLLAVGRSAGAIERDLVQTHGLTKQDLKDLWDLVTAE